jgi:hypothetical protein
MDNPTQKSKTDDSPKNTPWMILSSNKTERYLKTDDNKILNETYIRWVEKMNECFRVCVKSDGCFTYNTHKICKMNSPASYAKLNKYFTNDDERVI